MKMLLAWSAMFCCLAAVKLSAIPENKLALVFGLLGLILMIPLFYMRDTF